MPERKVREVNRAFLQRLDELSDKVRGLELRAFRGAVRTAHADAANPGVFDEYVSVLEVIVPSGRWLVNGIATFNVVSPTTAVDLAIKVGVFDPITDEAVLVPHSDVPPSEYHFATTSHVHFTAYCDGDIIVDDNVKVVLQSVNFAGDAYSLTNVRLTLNPV
jgi:hypothetical protein